MTCLHNTYSYLEILGKEKYICDSCGGIFDLCHKDNFYTLVTPMTHGELTHAIRDKIQDHKFILLDKIAMAVRECNFK